MIADTTYTWCLAGQFRIRCQAHDEQLIGFQKRIEGAVGYTLGWHDHAKTVRSFAERKPAGEETTASVQPS